MTFTMEQIRTARRIAAVITRSGHGSDETMNRLAALGIDRPDEGTRKVVHELLSPLPEGDAVEPCGGTEREEGHDEL